MNESDHRFSYIIGERFPRKDALPKVRGTEKYAVDYYAGDMVWAGAKRAGIPHGNLKNIDADRARACPGVNCVLTARDVRGTNRFGTIRKDQPVLAEKRIRCASDPIALVIAESKQTLKKALGLITFEYEPLSAVFDAEQALGIGTPIIHEENEEGNLIRSVFVEKGEGCAALARCEVVVEGAFEVPFQEHAYLETESGWAYLDEGGRLTIVASTQTPFRDRQEIGPALGLAPEGIRIIAPFLGGAFGGKDGITVQCLLGLAALHSGGRPVKMWWDREESFLAGVKRLPARMYYRLGAKSTGELEALECRCFYGSGPYANLSGEIMTLGLEHAGSVYRIPHTSIRGWCVYTNDAQGGPFRGFGVPQVTAAMEQMMDMLSRTISLDPLKLRRMNGLRRGDENPVGLPLTTSTGIIECLGELEKQPLWKNREHWKVQAPPFKKRGVGIAAVSHAMGYPPMVPDCANAKIEIRPDGRILVYSGVVDMGQGNASTYLQIVGSLLDQSDSQMELQLPDTDFTLPSGSASASRCTYVYGNALILAAEEMKTRLLRVAAEIAGRTSGTWKLRPGSIRQEESGKEVSLSEAAAHMPPQERACTAYYEAPAAKEKVGMIYMGPHMFYSYAAHAAFVEVDILTGAVEVNQYLAVTDAGKVLNPEIFEQQIQGAVVQGLGYALCEEYVTAGGLPVTKDLSTYIIPTSLDTPPIISIAIDSQEETGPFGMKGAGEIGISGPLPAAANGIADALGLRLSRSPFTGERVFTQLSKETGKGAAT